MAVVPEHSHRGAELVCVDGVGTLASMIQHLRVCLAEAGRTYAFEQVALGGTA
jgi:hypothetical protein